MVRNICIGKPMRGTERVSKVVPEIKVSNLLRSMAKDGRKFADLPAQPIKV